MDAKTIEEQMRKRLVELEQEVGPAVAEIEILRRALAAFVKPDPEHAWAKQLRDIPNLQIHPLAPFVHEPMISHWPDREYFVYC